MTRTYGPCSCERAAPARVVYCPTVSAYVDQDYHEDADSWSLHPASPSSQPVRGPASKWSLQAFVAKSKTALSRVVDKLSTIRKRDGYERYYYYDAYYDDQAYYHGRRPLRIYPALHDGSAFGDEDWLLVHGSDPRLPCQCGPCREHERMRHRKRTRAGRRKYRRSRFEAAAAMQISRNGGGGGSVGVYEHDYRHFYRAH